MVKRKERDPEEVGNQKVIFCFLRCLRKAEKNGDLDPQCWAILSMKILLSLREKEIERERERGKTPKVKPTQQNEIYIKLEIKVVNNLSLSSRSLSH